MAKISYSSQPTQRRRSIICYIILVILTLIFIAGVSVLITWFVMKPKKLHYTLENASVHNFNVTENNHISGTFKFTIKSHNPNYRVSVYYNSVETFIKFKGQTLAFDTMEPFHQPQKNVLRINDTLVAQHVSVSKSSGKALRAQTSSGKIDVEVFVKARVRFKIAKWKTSQRTVNIECSHVAVSLSQPNNNSQTSSCDADM